MKLPPSCTEGLSHTEHRDTRTTTTTTHIGTSITAQAKFLTAGFTCGADQWPAAGGTLRDVHWSDADDDCTQDLVDLALGAGYCQARQVLVAG